jgi:hypothetical protein
MKTYKLNETYSMENNKFLDKSMLDYNNLCVYKNSDRPYESCLRVFIQNDSVQCSKTEAFGYLIINFQDLI